MIYLIYFSLFVEAVVIVVCFSAGLDFFISALRRNAPEIPSSAKLRAAIVREIAENYPDAKTVLDIGACYGGMARAVAVKFPDKKVFGIEIMPAPYLVSRILKFFRGPKNMGLIFGDGMKFVEKSDGFDIGITWLLSPMMGRVEKISGKFGVMLVLDFKLPNKTPTRVIKLHATGARASAPFHILYVYENPRIKSA
ncbi:MAG: hypothetical protein LBD94_02785 [Rickettsiales bacterium]|jgi:hypothetical protein|nr:hypothetical protein [Rickettsiales bacterium]